jgi:hypothetical protein
MNDGVPAAVTLFLTIDLRHAPAAPSDVVPPKP